MRNSVEDAALTVYHPKVEPELEAVKIEADSMYAIRFVRLSGCFADNDATGLKSCSLYAVAVYLRRIMRGHSQARRLGRRGSFDKGFTVSVYWWLHA